MKSEKPVSRKARTSSASSIPAFPPEPPVEEKFSDVTLETTYTPGLMTEGEVTFFLKPTSSVADPNDHAPEE